MNDFIIKRFKKETFSFDFYSWDKWTSSPFEATTFTLIESNELIMQLDNKSNDYIYTKCLHRKHSLKNSIAKLKSI